MKRFLSLFIILACMVNFTACGAIGKEPDIDEGLHIAANDAEQRLDRLEDEDDGPVVFDPPKDEQPGNTDSNPTDPEPEDPYPELDLTDPEPDPWPPTNVPAQEDFWLDANTFDLLGYAESLGCIIAYDDPSDSSHPETINYCTVDFYSGRSNDNRHLSIYSGCYDAKKKIFQYMTGWQVLGGEDDDVNGYLDGNICEINFNEADAIASMVYIQSSGYRMPRPHFNATLTILERMAANDPECWYRGLGINHVGQTSHND